MTHQTLRLRQTPRMSNSNRMASLLFISSCLPEPLLLALTLLDIRHLRNWKETYRVNFRKDVWDCYWGQGEKLANS